VLRTQCRRGQRAEIGTWDGRRHFGHLKTSLVRGYDWRDERGEGLCRGQSQMQRVCRLLLTYRLLLAQLIALVEHCLLVFNVLQIAGRVAVQLDTVGRWRYGRMRAVHVVGRLGESRHIVLRIRHGELEEVAARLRDAGDIVWLLALALLLLLVCGGCIITVLFLWDGGTEGVVHALDVEVLRQLLGVIGEVGKIQIKVEQGGKVVIGADHGVVLLRARPCWRSTGGVVHATKQYQMPETLGSGAGWGNGSNFFVLARWGEAGTLATVEP